MMSFLITIQYLGIVLLFAEILYVIFQKTSKLQVLMLVVFIATLINFVGYLGELQASSMEVALQAVKFIYLGKPFIILGIFVFILEYYQIKIPKFIYFVLYALHVFVTFCVLTCEKNPLFYSSISYTQEGLFPHLVLGHGILYYVHTGMILLYSAIVIYAGISRFSKAKTGKERMQILTLESIGVICIASFILFLSGVTAGYDSTIPAYLLSTVHLLIAMVRYDLLDTLSIAKETIFDDFSDGLIVLNQDANILYVNSQVEQIYPEIKEEDSGKFVEEIESIYAEDGKIFAGEQIYEINKKIITQNKINYGQMYIIKDITQNFRYMRELEAQTQIAQKANKAKSDFLAKMSHEIRTPINSIIGMNEMILRESQQPQITEYALDAKTSAGALLGIINDILDTTKIESGKMELYPIAYQVDELLKTVVNIIRVKASEKSLEFKIEIDESLPCVLWGDDIRIRQILLNLLTNAVKFTDYGNISLQIQCEKTDDIATIRYIVSDTGIGIKESDLSRLYDEFSRVDEYRNREIEGTGLGMSIVVGLLKLMDSEIEVESEYDKGSTFSFVLKQKIMDHTEVGHIEFEDLHANVNYVYNSAYVAPNARILVVDDNKINRKVFKGLLKATQMDIVDLASGQECVELVQKEHFDLIFLDHMMPEMDGIETLHAMKALENNLCKDTPIIVLTANAVVGAREMYLSEGFDEFVAKPFDPTALEMLVQRFLNQGTTHVVAGEKPTSESKSEDMIPTMEEIDIEVALKHLDNMDIVRQTMLEFADSIESEMASMEQLMESITDIQSQDDYRIHVHTLKSTAAMIGAILLSKCARLSEVAAIEHDVDKIIRLHPVLMDELKKHKERLEVLRLNGSEDNADQSLEPIDEQQLISVLRELEKAAMELDSDTADRLMEEMKKKQLPASMKEDMDLLSQYFYGLQMDEAVQLIQKMIG